MVKVISLSEEAYSRLKTAKGERSFSTAVIGLLERKENKKSMMDMAGALEDDADEWGKIKNMIYEDRKKFKLRDVSL